MSIKKSPAETGDGLDYKMYKSYYENDITQQIYLCQAFCDSSFHFFVSQTPELNIIVMKLFYFW